MTTLTLAELARLDAIFKTGDFNEQDCMRYRFTGYLSGRALGCPKVAEAVREFIAIEEKRQKEEVAA